MQFSLACICVILAVTIHANMNHGMYLKKVPKSVQAAKTSINTETSEHIMRIKKPTVKKERKEITESMPTKVFQTASINAIWEDLKLKAKFGKNIDDEKKVIGVKVLQTIPTYDDLFHADKTKTALDDPEYDAYEDGVLVVHGTRKASDADNKGHCSECVILAVFAVSISAGLSLTLLFWYCEKRQVVHHLHRINTPRRKSIANLQRAQNVAEKEEVVPLLDDVLCKGANAPAGTKRARDQLFRMNNIVFTAKRNTAYNDSLEDVEREMHPKTWRFGDVTEITGLTNDEVDFYDEMRIRSELGNSCVTTYNNIQDEPVPSYIRETPLSSRSSPFSPEYECCVSLDNDAPTPAQIAMHLNCSMEPSVMSLTSGASSCESAVPLDDAPPPPYEVATHATNGANPNEVMDQIAPISVALQESDLSESEDFSDSGSEYDESSASSASSMVYFLDMQHDIETVDVPDLYIEDLSIEEMLVYYEMLIFMGMLDQEVDDMLVEEAANLFYQYQDGLE